MSPIEPGRGGRCWRRGIAMAICVLTGAAATGVAQTFPQQTLSRLTVTPDALPGGCHLEPPAADAADPAPTQSPRIRMWSVGAFPTNPWTGTEPAFASTVRGSVDPGPWARPDGVPLDPGQAAAFHAARAEHIVEAYRARYVSADGARVEVSALTFDDASRVREEPVSALTNPPRGLRSRFVEGATVVVVAAPMPGECVRVIEAHVRSSL